MLLPLRYGAFQFLLGRRRQASLGSRDMAQGLARLRHRLFGAVRADDLGDSIPGLQPVFPSPQRADRHRRSDASAVDASGLDLHRAGDGVRIWPVEMGGSKSRRASRGRPDPGPRISRAAVAVCGDASTRGAGRGRGHAERHRARRSGRRDGIPHVSRDRVWSDGIRQAIPLLLDRDHRGAPHVRRVDIHRGSSPAGQPADALDWTVGAHQHQRVPAVGRGAGGGAVEDRNIAGDTRHVSLVCVQLF